MRQFLPAGNVEYNSAASPDLVPAGAIGLFYMKDGATTAVTAADAASVKAKMFQLVLGRDSAKGGPVILDIHKNNFEYSKMTAEAAVKFKAEFTVGDITEMEDHSVIFVKKGVKFNERANWTATVHATLGKETPEYVAEQIAKFVNDNPTLGLTATAAGAKVTVEAVVAGPDYEVVPADGLYGVKVTYTNHGKTGQGTVAHIKDLALQAAADAGFRDTYQDDVTLLYPNYPYDPMRSTAATEPTFVVYTLRFAVPRAVKTRDEVVNQIVQIAVPTGAAQISDLDTIFAAFAE